MGAAIDRQPLSATVIRSHPSCSPAETLSTRLIDSPSTQLWSWMSWVQVPSSTPITVQVKDLTVTADGPTRARVSDSASDLGAADRAPLV
jgi:hypothetical protein